MNDYCHIYVWSLSGRDLISTRVQTQSWHFGYQRVGRPLVERRPLDHQGWNAENDAAAETLSTGKSQIPELKNLEKLL